MSSSLMSMSIKVCLKQFCWLIQLLFRYHLTFLPLDILMEMETCHQLGVTKTLPVSVGWLMSAKLGRGGRLTLFNGITFLLNDPVPLIYSSCTLLSLTLTSFPSPQVVFIFIPIHLTSSDFCKLFALAMCLVYSDKWIQANWMVPSPAGWFDVRPYDMSEETIASAVRFDAVQFPFHVEIVQSRELDDEVHQ